MLSKYLKFFASIAIVTIIVSFILCLMTGVYLLESGASNYTRAYALMLGSAGALVVLPKSFNLSLLVAHRRYIAIMGLATASILQMFICHQLTVIELTRTLSLVPYWLSSISLMVVSGLLLDCHSASSKQQPIASSNLHPVFQPLDLYLALTIFAISFGVRLLIPMSMAVDERLHFAEMLTYQKTLPVSPWALTGTGYPWLIHRIIFLLTNVFSPVATTFFITKALVACMGGLSVAFCFLTVRVFSSRAKALTAAILLILLGWHWLNSRFGYIYPYDLACTSLCVLAAAVALQHQRFGASIIAGVAMGCALILQKFGMVVPVFVGLLCLDYFLLQSNGNRRKIVYITSAIFLVAALCYLPFLIANGGLPRSSRIEALDNVRARTLSRFNLTAMQAFFVMFKDSLWQLQIKMYDIPRHVFRIGKPLLDPIFSALFFVGLVTSLRYIITRRESRIQLVGLIVFIVPMAVSFPLDSDIPRGLARRMLGTSFFCAWLASSGAIMLSSRLVRTKNIGLCSVVVAIASLLCNAWYIKTEYQQMPATTWEFDYGGKRAAVLKLCQSLYRPGMSVIVLNDRFSSIKNISDARMPCKTLESIEQIKSYLIGSRAWNVVILPWTSIAHPNSTIIGDLSGLIPPSNWILAGSDTYGKPLHAYAYAWPQQ
jgi:hypothetical protein